MLRVPALARLTVGVLVLAATASGCRRASAPAAALAPAPDTLRYATGFALVSTPEYSVLDVKGLKLALVDSGRAASAGAPPGLAVVRVPVRRIVALSTTHLGFLARIGATDALVGVVGAPWVNTPAVRGALGAGRVVDVAPRGAPSVEAIASLRPDVVFASSSEASELGAQLRALGIAVVPVDEHLEAHPLGRAEWLKVFGRFTGRRAAAEAAFDTSAARYERLRQRASGVAARPTVLLNSPYEGVWYVPGARSFAARQLADAGGAYVWASDTSATTLPLSLEAVLARAQRAEVWLAPGAWRSLADGAAQEPRVALFEAFRRGAVYNFDARMSPGGGFDVYETGVVEPEVVLADLVSILHPELLPGHERVYYRKLPAR